MAGFIVAINRIFTKLVFSERVGAIVFFVVSLLFVIMCIGCYVFIVRSPFVKYHMRRCRGADDQEMRESPSSGGSKGDAEEEELVERQDNNHIIQSSESQQLSLKQKIVGKFTKWKMTVCVILLFIFIFCRCCSCSFVGCLSDMAANGDHLHNLPHHIVHLPRPNLRNSIRRHWRLDPSHSNSTLQLC